MAEEKRMPTVDDIPSSRDRKAVRALLTKRWELKVRQDDTKAQIDELNANLCERFMSLNLKSVDAGDFIGIVVEGVNISVSGKKVRDRALQRGVDDEVIKDILDYATSVKEYITFSVRGKRGEIEQSVVGYR